MTYIRYAIAVILGGFGLFIIAGNWIAFLIDWGCIPGIAFTIIWHIIRIHKNRSRGEKWNTKE